MPDPSSAHEHAADALQRIRIVLVRTSHPDNIGAAARAML
ncbi:MAG: tRNA (cytosine(32)/uridine(32)-2'-O)-methyltransferase TrmJ, partial [Casimicrobiaceae bacterium]